MTFAVEAGGGTIDGETVRTGSDGIARVASWRLGPLPGENRVRASSASSSVTFTATARLLVPTVASNGTVTLPSGTRFTTKDLRVESAVTDVPVGDNGSFTALLRPGKSQFAAVHAPNGNPVLLAWLDQNHGGFSVHSTAAVLVFFGLKAYLQPSESARQIIRDYLASSADLHELEAAITQALKVDPAGVTLATDAIKAARQHVVQTLLAGASSSGPARGMSIDPIATEFSGISLDQTGFNSVLLTNNWRRRVVGFVDRLSYVPKGSSTSVPAPLPGTPVGLSSVTAATTIIGTFVDISAGKYAWVPVVSDPIPAPLYPTDALSTRYRVIVVGPGQPSGVLLSEAQDEARIEAEHETLILDLVLPFVDIVMTSDNLLQELGGAKPGGLVKAFFDLNPAPTEIIEAMEEGHWLDAVAAAEKLLFETELGQEFLLKNLFEPYGMAWGASATGISKRFKSWQKALAIVEIGATAVAIGQVVSALEDASQVVTWDVTATGAHTSVTPPNPRINQLDIQAFKATVTETTGGPAPEFVYRWSTSGNFGEFCAADATPACGKVIETPRDQAFYTPDPIKEGTDQIRVEVFIKQPAVRIAIGDATTQITTVATKVSIDPAEPTVPSGGSTTLTARLDTPPQDPGVLSYRWSTVGTYGAFVPASLNGQESSQSSMQYKAKAAVSGSELVSVEVFSTRDGTKRSVGRASATVKVDNKPTVVQGRYFSEVHSLPNNRVCAGAYIAFPLVQGAKYYDLHAYNFNDTLFWGTQINTAIFLVSYPVPWGTCDVKGLISGVNGNEFVFMLTGGSGPASSFQGLGPTDARFAGIKIDVTVHYDP